MNVQGVLSTYVPSKSRKDDDQNFTRENDQVSNIYINKGSEDLKDQRPPELSGDCQTAVNENLIERISNLFEVGREVVQQIAQQFNLASILPNGYPSQEELDGINLDIPDEDDGRHIWTLIDSKRLPGGGQMHTFGLISAIKAGNIRELQKRIYNNQYPATEPTSEGLESFEDLKNDSDFSKLVKRLGFTVLGSGSSIQLTVPGIGEIARRLDELAREGLIPPIEIIPAGGIASHRAFVILTGLFGIPLSIGQEFLHDFYIHLILRVLDASEATFSKFSSTVERQESIQQLNQEYIGQRRNMLYVQLMIDFGLQDIASPDSKFREHLGGMGLGQFDADEMLRFFQRRLSQVVDSNAYKVGALNILSIEGLKDLIVKGSELSYFYAKGNADYDGYTKEFGDRMDAIIENLKDYDAAFKALWDLYEQENPELAMTLTVRPSLRIGR